MKKFLIPLSAALAVLALPTLSHAEGGEVYMKYCKKCHGDTGKGDTAMGKKFSIRDYTKADVQAGLTDEAIVKSIQEGVSNEDGKKVMMPFGKKLSEEEIAAIVTYFRGLQAE